MPERPDSERRRYTRFHGDHYPLRIGRLNARLLDWSKGGVGLQVKEGIDSFTVGEPVELGILNEQIFAVLVFTGRIQRIDAARNVIGVDFLSGGDTIIPLLVELLGKAEPEPKP
jgi:hypothetical protein